MKNHTEILWFNDISYQTLIGPKPLQGLFQAISTTG